MKIYCLEYDHNHVDDTDYDAHYSVEDEGGKLALTMYSEDEFKIPDNMYFNANFDIVAKYDYLVNDLDWPLISKRFYNSLLELGSFKHRAIPIILADDRNLEKRFDSNGVFNTNIKTNDEFLALHIQEFPDVFDKERSVYEMHPAFPDKVGIIDKMYLKEELITVPIFKIEECSSMILVREDTKQMILDKGYKGFVLEDLDDVGIYY